MVFPHLVGSRIGWFLRNHLVGLATDSRPKTWHSTHGGWKLALSWVDSGSRDFSVEKPMASAFSKSSFLVAVNGQNKTFTKTGQEYTVETGTLVAVDA